MPRLETAPVGWHFAAEAGDETMTARKFASVKFADTFVEDARREATLFNRSVAGQIEHWARLGRALEGAPGIPVERVRETLEGRVKLETLSVQEQGAVFDHLDAWFDNPPEDIVAAYQEIGSQPGAVGLDKNGQLVRVRAKPRLRSMR